MTKLFLSLHVLAAILAIGPVAVAASVFPRYARALADGGDAPATAAFLHRTCRVYTAVGLAVPAFGLVTAIRMDALGDAWLLTSIALTVVAAVLLGGAILPGQERALAGRGDARTAARLAMLTGIFNLLWAVVVVLMIVRPGSSTGA